MAVGPQPYAETDRVYTVEATGAPGEYRLVTGREEKTFIRDFSDRGDDQDNQFGDVPNDTVSINESGTSDAVYVANTQYQNDILLRDNSGMLAFYTSRNYAVGETLRFAPVGNFVCYAAGTRIRTMRGDVPVEALRVGDFAVTASGAARPIRWLGHRAVDLRRHPQPHLAMPVRIAAGAFGPGQPARDLFVSPAHAIAVEAAGVDALVPAIRLVNGTTITQVEVETVTYWHVELDSHDIILAEGLPAESYLDCGNRDFFVEAAVTSLQAVPDARPEGALPFCRPFHEAGPVVEAVRAQLADRAEALGWRKVEDTFAGLHLVVDGRAVQPTIDGLGASFAFSADARDVRLVSETSVPAHVLPGSADDRRLGVGVVGIALDDGVTGARHIAADDTRLVQGWHGADGGTRWTDGAATLPADLWAGCRGTVRLDVALAGAALPRWIAPVGATDQAATRRWA